MSRFVISEAMSSYDYNKHFRPDEAFSGSFIGGMSLHRAWKRISDTYERILLFFYRRRTGLLIAAEILAFCILMGGWYLKSNPASPALSSLLSLLPGTEGSEEGKEKDFIKWVDFDVPEAALTKAFRYDVDTCQQQIHLNWIELLAYLGAKYGGNFSNTGRPIWIRWHQVFKAELPWNSSPPP